MAEVGADMGLLIRKRSHQETSDDQVHREDQNRRRHHRLRSGRAHALGSAARIHSVEAAYGGDDETENYRLDQSHKYILKHQSLPGIVPVLPGIEFQQEFRNRQTSDQSHKIRNDRQEEQHEYRGNYARRNQFLHGIGA